MDNKKKDNGGLYTAICCFAVVMAVVGFVNAKTKKETRKEEITKVIENRVLEEQEEKVEEKKALPKKEIIEEKKTESVSKSIIIEETAFSRPVSGNIITNDSGEDLLYNEALKDWRTHNGVDFEAKIGEKVLASANGVVEQVSDSEMGRSVVLEHSNGFCTVYANLSEDTKLKKGDEVSEGDVIGEVGNTALGDATEEPHLHFEIIKNGKNVNPTDYLE